jgi:heat shock protein HslJ
MHHLHARRALLTLPLLAALALAPACNSVKPEVDEVPRDLRGRWFLVELEGVDLIDLDESGVRRPEILIDTEGAVSGFGGVNRFGASLDLDVLGVKRFSLSRITSTMMAGPPEAMEAESAFLQALQDTRTYTMADEDRRLELRDMPEDDDEPGELIVVLARQR